MRMFLAIALLLAAGCSSQKVDGPVPTVNDIHKQDPTDENPRIMWTGAATPVTVSGVRFTPMIGDTLTKAPKVKVPALYLVNATSSTRLTNVVWINSTEMQAEIPAGIPVEAAPGWQDFQLVAEDPSGARSKPAANFRVSNFEPPLVTSVVATSGTNTQTFCGGTETPTDFVLTIRGESFAAGVEAVFFPASQTDQSTHQEAAVSSVSDTTLQVAIAAGQPAGTYHLKLTNPDGQKVTLPNAFVINLQGTGCAFISQVTPRFAYRGEGTPMQVLGGGFEATPKIALTQASFAVDVSYEAFLTDTTIQGLVFADAARPVGWYQMTVTNPDGTEAFLAKALLVIDQPAPKVATVTPDSLPGVNRTVAITGENFPASVTVAIFDGTNFVRAVTEQVASATRVYAEIPASTKGVFVLRVYRDIVINGVTEKIYGEYANIVIVGTSGNTDPWIHQESTLVTGRREFGLVGARNAVGNRYLYAVGGRTSNTDPNSGLATIEVAAVDTFGSLFDFATLPVTFDTHARYGLGLVEYEGWLYALGGFTTGTSAPGVTSEVLKAKILDPEAAPQVTGLAAVTGSLETGSWLYRVSAQLNSGDPENPGGETLAGQEVGLDLRAAGGVQFTWRSVANAASYRIYRTAAPNATSGSQGLLTTVSAAAACTGNICTFTDAGGALADASRTPLPRGALSVWTPAGVLNTARAFHNAVIARNQFGAPFVYVLGGQIDGVGTLTNSYEYAAVTTGGNLNFTEVNGAGLAMNVARRHAAAVVITAENTDPTLSPPAIGTSPADWVSVIAGWNGSSALSSAENAQVQDDGTLDSPTGATAFSDYSKSMVARVGAGATLAANVLFEFGGTSNDTLGGLSSVVTSGPLGPYSDASADNLAIATFNNNPDRPLDAQGNALPVAFFGYTRFNAQNFIVGGATATGVTNTIESVFY